MDILIYQCKLLIGSDLKIDGFMIFVFWQVLMAGNDLASEQTVARIVNLVQQIQQTLPPGALASTWSSLQPQQQAALKSILLP